MDNSLRLRVSSTSHNIYKKLCDKKGVFPNMADMFFWCVLLGYKNDKEMSPLGNKSVGIFNWGVFNDQVQKPVLKMIAVDISNDFIVLKDNDKENLDNFRRILEELAESGLSQLLMSFEENLVNHESLLSILVKEIEQ